MAHLRIPRWTLPLVMTIVTVTIPLAYGAWQAPSALSPSNLGVFSIFMGSPLQLVLPLVAVAIGCSVLYEDLGTRYVANLRTRMSLESYLSRTFARAVLLPFVCMGGAVIVIGIVCFAVWPAMGNPYIDPSLYHLDPGTPAGPDLARFTYSEPMAAGWPWYLVTYAALFGLACAAFSALGAAALLLVARRVVAVLLPWAIYLAETVLSALLGAPHTGLMYAIVPFGLQAVPALEGALPILVLVVAVGALWAWLWRRRYDLAALR